MWLARALLLILALSVRVTAQEPTPSTIPGGATSDPAYALGYLKCDYYGTNLNNGVTDATSALNTCFTDAWENALAAKLSCGTYSINTTLTAYEWQNIDTATGKAKAPDPRVHVIRGSDDEGCRTVIKIATSSTNFDSTASPRPMFVKRNFLAIDFSGATDNALPSNPLGLPANFKDGDANDFSARMANIDFDTNGKAGAIGISFPSAQGSGIYNTTITATGSYAGIYGLPGRNSIVANATVNGGQHCIGSGPSVWGLNLDNSDGHMLAGITCTGQTAGAIEINDNVPTTITGLALTKSTSGIPLRVKSPFVLIDARFDLSSGAANATAIDNSDERTIYLRETFFNGTTNLVKNGTATKTGTGTWVRLAEHVYNDPFSKDGSSDANTYPVYTNTDDTRFEARSVINGTVSGSATPTETKVDNSSAPPSDLISRHKPADIASYEDGSGTFTSPIGLAGCTSATPVIPGYGQFADDGNTGPDCRAGLQQAIDDAQTAGHNRVAMPRGVLAIIGNTEIVLHKDTKLMCAGGGLINVLAYKSTWAPTTEKYLITTDSDATGTAQMNFCNFFVRSQPQANQWMSYFHWRVGKNSQTLGLEFDKQHQDPNFDTNPLKLIRFSGNGGGKHYVLHNSWEQLDSNAGARVIYAENGTQPLSLYGQNMEITKKSSSGGSFFADANAEFNNWSNARVYGCKREGQSPTAIITDSDNIGIYGCGAMNLNIGTKPGWLQILGASSNILAAVQVVRDLKQVPTAGGPVFIREAISPAPTPANAGSVVPWPTGISLYKRGTIDDGPFGAPPSPNAPTPQTYTITVANRVDLCFQIFDGLAMLPSSGVTGITISVNGGANQSPTTTPRQGNACYQLNFTPGTFTAGSTVTLSYTPGNLTSGGSVPVEAFGPLSVTNSLTSPPVQTQTSCAFRSIFGPENESNWYADGSGTVENYLARFIQGGQYRVRCKVTNTVAASTTTLVPCFDINPLDADTFLPLTNSCTTDLTCFASIPEVGDGQATTQQLVPVLGTFVPGVSLEQAGTEIPLSLPLNSETEIEFGAQIDLTAPVNRVYRYALCKPGAGLLNSYTKYGQVTVITPRGTIRGGGTSR